MHSYLLKDDYSGGEAVLRARPMLNVSVSDVRRFDKLSDIYYFFFQDKTIHLSKIICLSSTSGYRWQPRSRTPRFVKDYGRESPRERIQSFVCVTSLQKSSTVSHIHGGSIKD